MPPARSIPIRERVSVAEFVAWWASAFRDLRAALEAPGVERNGADAALYSGEFFEDEVGEVVAFIPIRGVEGPIREYYLVTPFETKQVTELRTEVGWPVFLTG